MILTMPAESFIAAQRLVGRSVVDEMEMSAPAVYRQVDLDNQAYLATDKTLQHCDQISQSETYFLPVDTEWNQEAEKQFKALARRNALSLSSSAEDADLERLQRARRQHHHPRTGEEVLQEYRQNVITQNLLQALREYVNFFDRTKNCSR